MVTTTSSYGRAYPCFRACALLCLLLACQSLLLACKDDNPPGHPSRGPEAGAAGDAPHDAADGGDPEATDPAPDASHAPEAAAMFRAALENGRYDDLPDVLAELELAAERAPEDGPTVLALALANLWGVAEMGRTAEPDPAREAGFAFAAEMYLTRALELMPDDARIYGWLGSVHISIGRKTGSAELVQEGFDELAIGVARDPAFNLFVEAFQHARRDRDDPQFARGAERFWQNAELCRFDVGPERPRLSSAPSHDAQVSPVCSNGAKMPHNVEGFWVFGGDILLKTGDAASARALYENATLGDGHDDWPHRAIIAQRLNDAESWAERLVDDDPSNDPQLVWDSPTQCVLCHQR